MRLGDGAYLVQSVLYQMSTVVLAAQDGGAFVVDPGYFPQELERIRRLVRRVACGEVRVVLTHSDFDHIVGTYAFSPATILASASWDRENERAQLRLARAFDEEHLVARPRRTFAPRRVHLPVGREGLLVAGLRLTAVPGHTRDSLLCYHEPSGVLVLGDYLSAIEFPEVAYDFRAYALSLATIARLVARLPVSTAVPGHGPPHQAQEALLTALRRDAAYLLVLLEEAIREAEALPDKEAARVHGGGQGVKDEGAFRQVLRRLAQATKAALRPYGRQGRFFPRHQQNVAKAFAAARNGRNHDLLDLLDRLASGKTLE